MYTNKSKWSHKKCSMTNCRPLGWRACFQMNNVNFRQVGELHKKAGCGKGQSRLQKRAALRPAFFCSPA